MALKWYIYAGKNPHREHSRRASPRHALPLRPGGRTVAAARPAAAGAALPHADPVLFAAHHAGRPLPQLAAGSAEQLRRAADVPRKGRRVPRRSRPGRRDGGLQPVRLLPRAVRRTLPVLLRDVGSCASCSRSCTPSRSRRASPRYLDSDRSPRAGGPSTSSSTSTATCSSDISLRHPPRPRRAGRGAHARAGIGLVPRHDVAARATVPPPRARRALRVRLSDSAGPGREGARRTRGRRPATSPISTPGARSTCPAPAGSASTRRRDCSRAKGTSRWPARRSRRAPRRSRAASSRARSSSSTRCRCSGSTNRRASPSPTPTRNGRRSSRAAARSTPTSRPATSA